MKLIEPKVKPFSSKLPKKLVRLLESTAKFIVENPKQFDIQSWAYPSGTLCGTVGCIGGHMALKDTPKREVRRAVLEDLSDFKRSEERWGKENVGSFVDYSTHLQDLVESWRSDNIPGEFRANFDQLFDPGSPAWGHFRTPTGKITPKKASAHIMHFLKTGDAGYF